MSSHCPDVQVLAECPTQPVSGWHRTFSGRASHPRYPRSRHIRARKRRGHQHVCYRFGARAGRAQLDVRGNRLLHVNALIIAGSRVGPFVLTGVEAVPGPGAYSQPPEPARVRHCVSPSHARLSRRASHRAWRGRSRTHPRCGLWASLKRTLTTTRTTLSGAILVRVNAALSTQSSIACQLV